MKLQAFMPTFDFLCENCGHVFEFTRPFGSKVNPACPACKSRNIEKQITPPTIQFKGEGFYKTDSRTVVGKPKKEPAADAPATAPLKEPGAPKSAKDPLPEKPKEKKE